MLKTLCAWPERYRGAAGIAARTPSDAKALSVSTHSVRKGGRESFALCDEGGAVAVFEPANP